MDLFIALVLLGLCVGILGAVTRAPLWLVGLLAFVMGGVVTLSYGAEKPIEKLRATTLHVANGSGAVVQGKSGKQYILTNWHVCLGVIWKGTLTAHYHDGQTLTGKVAAISPAIDLCAARIVEKREALRLGHQPFIKQDVWTRGYPGHILAESHGHIGRDIDWQWFVPIEMVGECPRAFPKERGPDGRVYGCVGTFSSTLTSLYGRPGSSGSPVVDSNGDIVGVVSSWHSASDYEAGIVKYSQLQGFLEAL